MNAINQLCGQYILEMPGNGIDRAGIDAIQQKLCGWGYGSIPDGRILPPSEKEVWRWEWKINGKGEYVGALPKRLGKLVWQVQKKKLTPEQLTELGNIGARHSGKHRQYYFDVVNKIDWERSDFGQPSDCCYWGCHSSAKDMLLKNGAGAIRFFDDDSYSVTSGFGRAWLIPWEDCWIVFNGYGLETLQVARILSAHLDHAYYRRISLYNNGNTGGDLWINGGTAYLVGPQGSVLKWERIDLKWEEEQYLCCENCEYRIYEDNHYHSPDGENLCEECYCERCFYCSGCCEDYWHDDGYTTPEGERLCRGCWEEDYFQCNACKGTVSKLKKTEGPDGKCYCEDNHYHSPDGEDLCEECYCERYAHCDDCCEDFPIDDIVCREDGYYCPDCAPSHTEKEEGDLCPAV